MCQSSRLKWAQPVAVDKKIEIKFIIEPQILSRETIFRCLVEIILHFPLSLCV